MSRFTYKTKDGSQNGFIPGFGAIVDGTISSDSPIESPNLELLDGTDHHNAPIEGVASQQNPVQPESAGDATDEGVTNADDNKPGVQLG